MNSARWIKSSHSSANGDCIEVTADLDRVRDSKDPDGPALRVDVTDLVRAVKTGRYDREVGS